MAHVEDGHQSRRIVDLVDHAIDADPKAVGALPTDYLTHALWARGQAESVDALEAASRDLRGRRRRSFSTEDLKRRLCGSTAGEPAPQFRRPSSRLRRSAIDGEVVEVLSAARSQRWGGRRRLRSCACETAGAAVRSALADVRAAVPDAGSSRSPDLVAGDVAALLGVRAERAQLVWYCVRRGPIRASVLAASVARAEGGRVRRVVDVALATMQANLAGGSVRGDDGGAAREER